MAEEDTPPTAAKTLLRSLKYHGVDRIFANFGTDHTPLIEAAAALREAGRGDDIPEFVICPHEGTAMSAAHGAAATSGRPQGVLVHVDVGTQNLGGMVHNAHRGNAPVFIIAGEAPVSHGSATGSRSMGVHYLQDAYDQHGILREYTRWHREYRPPADPDELVSRGLRMATNPRRGPVYLTAARESLEANVPTRLGSREVDTVTTPGADVTEVQALAEEFIDAEAPLVVTSTPSTEGDWVGVLTDFAEAVGAGVVEATPAQLCFPRDHDLHLGFIASRALDHADLILLCDVDVPWVPAEEVAPTDATVVQIDHDPLKTTYPQWDVPVDRSIEADPCKTLVAIRDAMPSGLPDTDWEPWATFNRDRRRERQKAIEEQQETGTLGTEIVTQALNDLIDESTVVVSEELSASQQLDLATPGAYYGSHGSALGWAPGAAVGVKLAEPDKRVVALVGDGTYIFANPTSAGWLAGAQDAPTLTVIYNNSGWNAVKFSTLDQHPEGSAARVGIPESEFDPRPDLSRAAHVVDAFSATIEAPSDARSVLKEAIEAVDDGTPAVVDVHLPAV